MLGYYGSTKERYLNEIRNTSREVMLEFYLERHEGINWTRSNEVEEMECIKG